MQMERTGTGPRETFCSFVDQPENRVLGRRYGIGVRNGCKSKPSEFEWLLLFRGWVLISSGGSCSVLFRSFCLAFFSLRIKMSRFLSLSTPVGIFERWTYLLVNSFTGRYVLLYLRRTTNLFEMEVKRWKFKRRPKYSCEFTRSTKDEESGTLQYSQFVFLTIYYMYLLISR